MSGSSVRVRWAAVGLLVIGGTIGTAAATAGVANGRPAGVAVTATRTVALPDPSSKRIAPFQSVGGLRLGDPLRFDDLPRGWPGHPPCSGPEDNFARECDWGSRQDMVNVFTGPIGSRHQRVLEVALNYEGNHPTRSRVRGGGTREGYGIGITLAAARRIYPRLRCDKQGVLCHFNRGRRYFASYIEDGRVSSVAVSLITPRSDGPDRAPAR